MDRRGSCDHGVRGRRVARASRFVLVYLFNLWIRSFGEVDMGILLHRHAREDLHDGILDIVARFAHSSHRFITR
jgi:hypothetical protein